MELENFSLAKYNRRNPEHKTVVIEICNDKDGRTYLGDLEYYFMLIEKDSFEHILNGAYIAYYNDRPVGFISLKYNEGEYHIAYGITPENRKEHLGALLLQEFSEKVFMDNENLESLILMINDLNTGSKKMANLAGYTKVNSTKYKQDNLFRK